MRHQRRPRSHFSIVSVSRFASVCLAQPEALRLHLQCYEGLNRAVHKLQVLTAFGSVGSTNFRCEDGVSIGDNCWVCCDDKERASQPEQLLWPRPKQCQVQNLFSCLLLQARQQYGTGPTRAKQTQRGAYTSFAGAMGAAVHIFCMLRKATDFCG